MSEQRAQEERRKQENRQREEQHRQKQELVGEEAKHREEIIQRREDKTQQSQELRDLANTQDKYIWNTGLLPNNIEGCYLQEQGVTRQGNRFAASRELKGYFNCYTQGVLRKMRVTQ